MIPPPKCVRIVNLQPQKKKEEEEEGVLTETAVLVVRDDEQRLVPVRRPPEVLVDLLEQRLTTWIGHAIGLQAPISIR